MQPKVVSYQLLGVTPQRLLHNITIGGASLPLGWYPAAAEASRETGTDRKEEDGHGGYQKTHLVCHFEKETKCNPQPFLVTKFYV